MVVCQQPGRRVVTLADLLLGLGLLLLVPGAAAGGASELPEPPSSCCVEPCADDGSDAAAAAAAAEEVATELVWSCADAPMLLSRDARAPLRAGHCGAAFRWTEEARAGGGRGGTGVTGVVPSKRQCMGEHGMLLLAFTGENACCMWIASCVSGLKVDCV